MRPSGAKRFVGDFEMHDLESLEREALARISQAGDEAALEAAH